MANQITSTSSFLKEAFESYSSYSNQAKQNVHKYALKWLQRHIESDLEDKTIMEKFTQKWRAGTEQSGNTNDSPLYLENLPGSYKKSSSISNHQEDALVFIHEQVPSEMQEKFQQRWNLKTQLEVSSSSGTQFRIDERQHSVLQQEDPEGKGIAWYQVEKKQTYYLLSFEEKDDQYIVVLGEEISPQKRDTWFVDKKDVKISNV